MLASLMEVFSQIRENLRCCSRFQKRVSVANEGTSPRGFGGFPVQGIDILGALVAEQQWGVVRSQGREVPLPGSRQVLEVQPESSGTRTIMPTSAAAKTHAKMIELTTFEFIVSSTFAHYFTSSISPGF